MTVSWYDGATIEVSFTQLKGALDPVVDGDFTDISAYVRGTVTINRGRGAETDAFSTGTAQLTLDNRDRRFDPEYSSGPYYGNLLPMRHLRVRLTYSGSTSYLFHGFVRSWEQGWDVGDTDAVCNLVADDGFKIFAQTALPESIYYSEILTDTPTAWYRMGESTGAVQCLDSSGNSRHGLYEATTVTNALATGLIELSSDGARQFTMPSSGAANTRVISNQGIGDGMAYVAGGAWSWEMWLALPSVATYPNSSGHALWSQSTALGAGSSGTTYFQVYFGQNFDGTRYIQIDAKDNIPTTSSLLYNLSSSLNDGDRHHLCFTRDASTVAFYIDGVAQTAASTSGSYSLTGVTYGSFPSVDVNGNSSAVWTYDEIALYSSALSSGRVTAHYTAGSTAYAGDDTIKDRIARVMTAAGANDFTVASEQDTTLVRGCDFSGGSLTLLAYLQMLERTENGRVFISADGALTFFERYHDAGRAVSTAFSDATSSTLPYLDLGHEYNDSRIINDARVSRTSGVVQRVVDATSQTAYGTRTVTVDGLALQSDSECLDRATAIVHKYKDPKARFTAVTVAPRAAPSTLFPVVRQREIGDRISVRRLPVGTGSAFTKELTIEGVTHRFDVRGSWVTSYLTAPGDMSSVWLILDDSTYGLLDTGRLGF